MKNSFYKVASCATAIALCLAGLIGEARAQAERASSPVPSRQVPNDPLKPIPQTNKTLINDVELRDRLPAAPPDNEEANVEEAIPSSLAKALSRALHSNPDVLLAVARLDEVRAERDRMRLKVVEQVTTTVNAYKSIMLGGGPPLQAEGRTLDRHNVGAELGYLLGAGDDEPLEEMKKNDANNRTNAEALASSFGRNLGKALERALRSNPDLRLAEARVHGAQAELTQIRLTTVRKVAIAFHRWQNDKQAMALNKANHDAGIVQMEEVLAARQAAAESEAEILYLLGADAPEAGVSAEMPAISAAQPPAGLSPAKRPDLPKNLQAPLGKKASIHLKAIIENNRAATLGDALKMLSSQCDVPLVASNAAGSLPANLETGGELSVLTILEMIADQTGCAFIVRDYGLLAVPRNEAWQYPGAAIPSDAPSTPDGAKGR